MSQRGISLAIHYRQLMNLAGFQSDNEFIDNFDPNNVIHQEIQATRLAYFKEAMLVYGLE